MRLVFLGLSLSSSWGNGHATTYRALLRALDRCGHEVLFLERDQPWYAAHRDLPAADFCALRFYDRLADLDRYSREITQADAVIVGSYVPNGAAVIDQIAGLARVLGFYDIDTPVTMAALAEGGADYLRPGQIPRFDLYLSFTGGPSLQVLERDYGARLARPLYCTVDAELHRPMPTRRQWDLGYLGTYSADRQPMLERLLIEPARRLPQHRFAVVGPLYPDTICWPANVDRIEHLGPAGHPDFYSSLGWALNLTRADMRLAGYSPSVRLFEASACGCPILSDLWPGLETFFQPGRDLLVARGTEDVMRAMAVRDSRRSAIGAAGRARTMDRHTADIRAQELEGFLEEARMWNERRSLMRIVTAAGAEA